MSERVRLPNRHECDVIDFEHFGSKYTAHVSKYDNGKIAEIFLSGWKAGSDMEATIRDASIAVSVALQCGAQTDNFRKSLTRESSGRPSGALGKILDIIAADERAAKKADA